MIDNPVIRIFVDKIESSITLRINTRFYLEFVLRKTRNLFGTPVTKVTKDENYENFYTQKLLK